jgi:hypothetical protein
METLELPVIDDLPETEWPVVPPPKFEEQAMDIAAFKLWREASRMDSTAEE